MSGFDLLALILAVQSAAFLALVHTFIVTTERRQDSRELAAGRGDDAGLHAGIY